MAQLNVGDTIAASVAEQVRIYDERYVANLMAPAPQDDWLGIVADIQSVSSPVVRYPVALISGSFQETKADNRDVEWADKYVDLNVVEYDWGYEAQAIDLATNPIKQRQWAAAPGLAVAKERLKKMQLIAATLEANPVGYDAVTLFNDSHPLEGSNTFDNLQASALDLTNVNAVLTEKILGEQQLKDLDGQLTGAEFDIIMTTPARASALRFLLQQNFIPSAAGTATVSNPMFGSGLRVIGNPFLTGAFAYFISSSLKQGMPPLVLLDFDPGSPLRLRQFGYESDHFKSTGRIKNSHHIWIGAGAVFPQSIRRVALS